MTFQIKAIHEEIQVIKRNQAEILEVKNIMTPKKSSLDSLSRKSEMTQAEILEVAKSK